MARSPGTNEQKRAAACGEDLSSDVGRGGGAAAGIGE